MPRPRAASDGLVPVPAVVDGRFRIHRVLQRRFGAATLAGTDQHTGAPVILKVTRSDSLARGVRLRLLHEAGVPKVLRSAA